MDIKVCLALLESFGPDKNYVLNTERIFLKMEFPVVSTEDGSSNLGSFSVKHVLLKTSGVFEPELPCLLKRNGLPSVYLL